MTLRNPNRTRILATLGPATDSLAAVHDLLRAGADAFRINMSHGAAAGRARLIGFVQQARMELDLPVSIVADLRGPRLRLASVPEGSRRLKRGESVTVVAGARAGAGELAIDYPRLVQDLAPKKRILLRDGRAELVVKSISGRRIL
ncbi:MAG TPA: pyruvate kinase, partial [Planctomycetota bacterium]